MSLHHFITSIDSYAANQFIVLIKIMEAIE